MTASEELRLPAIQQRKEKPKPPGMMAQSMARKAARDEFENRLNAMTLDDMPGRRKAHPLFTTSSSDYGKKGVNVAHQPSVWGRQGNFTKQFPERKPFTGLDTTITRNPCLPNPTFGNNPYHESCI